MSAVPTGGMVAVNLANTMSRRQALLLPAVVLPFARSRANAQPAADTPPGDAAPPAPGADAVADMLAKQVDQGRFSLGYVAAMGDASGSQVVTAGRSGAEDGRALDGATVFEIGSITKVFTALLLADMVQRGEVAFADPAGKYLPAEAQPRTFDGKPFSLLDLATHTSGLPRMPGNIRSSDPADPYVDYTVDQLYQSVRAERLAAYPGSHYSYSNLGMGLLGHILALRAGQSYEALLLARICGPLGLADTRVTLTPDMQARLTPGHDGAMRRVANWELPVMAGAGALRSTANDLLRFLDACQGRRATPLQAAMAAMLEVRRQSDTPGEVVAAGWFVRNRYRDELVWKDGDTGGYSAFIGYSTRSGRAAVLLANTASGVTTPEIGRHLLNARFALPTLHQAVAIDAAALAGLAGRYAMTPIFVLTVTPRDDHLGVQATNQQEFGFYPESSTRFFARDLDAQLTFEIAADGTASAVVLHQNGRDMRAGRIP